MRPTACAPGGSTTVRSCCAVAVAVVEVSRGVVPPEHAAQDRVAVLADPLGRLEHVAAAARFRYSSTCETSDRLVSKMLRHDLGRAGGLQCIEPRIVLGAHQHRHVRAQAAHAHARS